MIRTKSQPTTYVGKTKSWALCSYFKSQNALLAIAYSTTSLGQGKNKMVAPVCMTGMYEYHFLAPQIEFSAHYFECSFNLISEHLNSEI